METKASFLTCSGCGAQVPKDAKSCDTCGTELASDVECRACGAKQRDCAQFCDECGLPLNQPLHRDRALTSPPTTKSREFFTDDEVRRLVRTGLVSDSRFRKHLQGERISTLGRQSARNYVGEGIVQIWLDEGFITKDQSTHKIVSVMPDQRVVFYRAGQVKDANPIQLQRDQPQFVSLGRRLAACLIDMVFMFGGVWLISNASTIDAGVGSYVGITLVVYVWTLLYRTMSAWLFGTTLGKAILGLYLASEDATATSTNRGKAVKRESLWTIFAGIPVFNVVWAITTFSDPQKHGWHDKAAGTTLKRKP